jgi:hypothetical protein
MKALGIPEKKEHINDNVFEIQLLRRGKDNPDMPAANYSFKNYYVDSLESYDRYEEEIKKCCDMFRLRAYISVNVKSKEKLQLQSLKIIADNLAMGELKKPLKIFYKAFGTTVAQEQRWIVDVDWQDEVDNDEYISQVKHIIESCQSGYDKNVICEVPTKSGVHLITHPFNMKEYRDAMEKYAGDDIDVPEIKKNHLTLLYENLA